MKKYFLFSVMVLTTLCFSFSSCSKDDDESGGGSNEFYEISVEGKTYKNSDVPTFRIVKIDNVSMQNVCQTNQSVHYLDVNLSVPTTDNELSNYKQSATYNVIYKYNYAKTFDLIIGYSNTKETDDSYYSLQSGSNNITDIKSINKDDVLYYANKDGVKFYTVSGNFSCVFKNSKTQKEVPIEGKYRIVIAVSE